MYAQSGHRQSGPSSELFWEATFIGIQNLTNVLYNQGMISSLYVWWDNLSVVGDLLVLIVILYLS